MELAEAGGGIFGVVGGLGFGKGVFHSLHSEKSRDGCSGACNKKCLAGCNESADDVRRF